MDSLEKFIHDNRDELKPKPEDKNSLWKKIEMELPAEKKEAKFVKLSYRFLARAAAILVAFGLAFTVYFNNGSMDNKMSLSPEMMEINAHYTSLVQMRFEQVKNNTALTNEQKSEFFAYVKELETEAAELQEELDKNLNNELIIESMIKNYKERMRLMEQLLNRVEKTNKKENEENIII